MRKWAGDQLHGVGRPRLGLKVIRALPVPLPPVSEQRRIVDLLDDHLSRLDAASESLQAAAERAKGLRERSVVDCITGAEASGLRRPAGLSNEGLNDGGLRSLPQDWTWKRLHEVADVVGGITKDASKQADPSYVEVPYLRVANVQRGRLDLSSVTRIRAPRAKAEALRLLPGDVLLNEGGDRDKLGRGWVWEGQVDACIHQNHVFRARIRGDQLQPKLLSWAANYIGGAWCERNGKQSVNLASISLSKIRMMPVPVPPGADQDSLVETIDAALGACDRMEAAIHAHTARATSLRRSLLSLAFTGRL